MRRSYAVWRAFWSDRRAAVAAVFLLVEIALVLFLPLFLGQDPNLTDRSAGFWAAPSAQHWLGTDDVGRDLFARLLYGGRTSLLVGFASAALGVVAGNWEKGLEALADVTEADNAAAQALVDQGKIKVTLSGIDSTIFLEATVTTETDTCTVTIRGSHTNIVSIVHNGATVFEKTEDHTAEPGEEPTHPHLHPGPAGRVCSDCPRGRNRIHPVCL